jgi:peptidoglycan/LPS O-acetylase OafA/YrhL
MSHSPAPFTMESKVLPALGPAHIGVLDLLRGLAAVSVTFYHFTTAHTVPAFTSSTMNTLFSRGYLGVDVFFVISGFIIPYSLWNTSYKTRYLFSYLKKRLIRICPPAYLSLLVVLLQWAIISYLLPQNPNQFATLTAIRIFRNLTFTYYYLHPGWMNSVFWTLGIEIKFYAFIGLFFNLLFKSSNLFYFILIFLLVSAGYFFVDKYDHGSFALSSLFALGGATLFYVKKRITFSGYLLLLILFGGISFFNIGFEATVAGTITALVIAFVHLENYFFKLLGKISYSIYLIHIPAGHFTCIILSRFLYPTSEFQNAGIIVFIFLIVSGFAYAFSEIVEAPFLRLARKVKLAQERK